MSTLQLTALAIASVVMGLVAAATRKGGTRVAVLVITVALALVALAFPPSSFADYSAYVDLASGLRNTSLTDLPIPEFLSRLLIKAMPEVAGGVESGVDLLARLVLCGALAGYALLGTRYCAAPANVAYVTALFGPILVFVVLRASFAYFLVSLMLLRGPKYDRWAVALLLLGLSFHISVLLIVPTLLAYEGLLRYCRGSGNRCLAAYAVVVFVTVVWRAVSAQFLGLALVLAGPLTEAAGFTLLNDYFEAQMGGRSVSHDIYLVAVFLFGLLLFWIERDSESLRKRALFVGFLAVFGVLQMSPVAAFRYSAFVMIPLLATLDLGRRVQGRLDSIATGLASGLVTAAAFVFTFVGVLATP